MDTGNPFLKPPLGKGGEGRVQPGQDIVLLGYVGLEGSLRILGEREEELKKRFPSSFIRGAKEQKTRLYRPRDLKAAEGFDLAVAREIGSRGIFAALWDLGESLNIGFKLNLFQMSIRQETVEICEYFRLNPYKIESAGSFLIVTAEGDELVKAFEDAGKHASVLGRVTAGKARTIKSGAGISYLNRPCADKILVRQHRGPWQKNK